jgi:hypothetical protein
MGWRLGVAALCMLALGLATVVALDHRRLRQSSRVPRAEVDRWEDEGGAIADIATTPT